MRHTQPTPMAHTPRSGSACADQAGTAQFALPDSPVPLSEAERLQLSEQVRANMDEEIQTLKAMMKEFARAVDGEDDPQRFQRLTEGLNMFGLSCSRLANSLRVSRSLRTGEGGREEEEVVNRLMRILSLAPEEGEQP
ncbi:MAG: hypothetical protein ACOYKD_07595 [Anaerolineaceae bacterium]|jgi:hypothetical protein